MPARRFRALLGILALAFAALSASAVQSSEAFAASWATGVEASAPAGAGPDPGVALGSVSCPSAGECSAVGTYTDSAGHGQGVLLTESAGTWATGVEATLPAGAGTNPAVSLSSVSCAAAGNCGAVGSYLDSSGNRQGVLLTESAGTWAPGITAILPANAGSNPSVVLNSVSCAAAGDCSAVGSYLDSSGNRQGLLLTESAGTWTTGVEALLPADAGSNPGGGPISVSCAAAGYCSAVGNYVDSSGNVQGLLLTEAAGTWATGEEATPPADALSNTTVGLDSVSCTSPSACSAVGIYLDSSSHNQGVLLTKSSGSWTTGVEATPPANAGSDPSVAPSSVSCAAASDCSAVGTYADSSGHQQGLLLTETAGTWATGVEALLPTNAGSVPSVGLGSVSCAAAGDCSAVGSYLDSSGHRHGVLLTETAGTWATGVEALLPANPASNPSVSLFSVSCAAAGNCGAVGRYTDSPGNRQGLLLNTLRRLTVLKAGSGRGSVTSSPAGISCGAICAHAFVSGKPVTLTATPVRGSRFAGWSGACSGRGSCHVGMTADRTVTARFTLLPPDTKITKAKIDQARQRAVFKFKALGKSTGFQCALVKAKKHKKPKPHFSNCNSPKTYTGLAPGSYSFRVRAFGAAGADPTPAKKSFKI